MLRASGVDMTASSGTSQNMAIFEMADSLRGSEHLPTMMSGLIPMLMSSLTECCVGFVFSSPTEPMMGIRVVWMNMTFSSLPSSLPSCLAASRNGMDSMSPTVPPSSTMTTSAPDSRATFVMRLLISFVMWGMIWTVFPR